MGSQNVNAVSYGLVAPGKTRIGPDDVRVQRVYRIHGWNKWSKLAPHYKERTKSPTELKAFGAASAFLRRIRGQTMRSQAGAGGGWWWKRTEENLLVLLCLNGTLRGEPGSIGPPQLCLPMSGATEAGLLPTMHWQLFHLSKPLFSTDTN